MALNRPSLPRFLLEWFFYIVAGILFITGKTEAVVIGENERACGGLLTGSSGNITSPGYPNNYAENLLCSWNVTVDSKFRIEIDFLVFDIEAGIGCLYDYVLIRDGLTLNSPVLGKICHVNPQSILSTGSSVLVQFASDMSVGKRGFYLRWRTVPKVPLLLPNGISVSSPWLAIPTPKNLAQIDGGISESLWGIDTSENIYIYFNNKWDLVDGRMIYVTSGESVFGISSNGDVWYRQGVLLENPKGFGWRKIRIDKPMKKIESGRKGIAIALGFDGSLFQLEVKDSGATGVFWRLMSADTTDPLVELSCGSYACWFVSKGGNVFIASGINAEAPQTTKSFNSILQKVSGAQMKQVEAGFGESVWGITNLGTVYKRTGTNALLPEGSGWQEIPDVLFSELTVGLTGVYGLTKSNILITIEELQCGGIVHEKKGQFSTPNHPRQYPRGLTCLWVIRVPDSKGIAVKFNNPVGIGMLPTCLDYVLTFEDGKYPSQAEPVIECGGKIDEKFFNRNEVWIEFRSTGSVGGTGFQATYEAWFTTATTSPTRLTKTLTASTIMHQVSSVRTTMPLVTTATKYTNLSSIFPTTSAIGEKLLKIGKDSNAIDTVFNRIPVSSRDTSQLEKLKTNQIYSSTSLHVSSPSRNISNNLQSTFSLLTSSEIFPKISDISIQRSRSLSNSIVETSKIEQRPNLTSSMQRKEAVSGFSSKSAFIGKLTNTYFLRSSTIGGMPIRHTQQTIAPTAAHKNIVVQSTLSEQSNPTLFLSTPSSVSSTEVPLPRGWQILKSPKKMLLVSSSITDNVWALDMTGRPYVLFNDEWRPISRNVFKSLAVGLSGVWGVTEKGNVLYRQGVTSQDKRGLHWLSVDGHDIAKILVGPMNEVIGIKRDGSLVWRFGATLKSPSGTEWVDLGKRVIDASVGNYGLWIVNRTGDLQFGLGKLNANSKNIAFEWRSVPGKFKKIRVGYGGSLWGVLLDGKLAKRVNINFLQPTGTGWDVSDNFPTNDVGPGMTYVYRTMSDGTVLRKEDNTCGGLLSTIQGSFQSPNYPSTYPKNAHCLWTIHVPEAKQIQLYFEDFDVEQEQYCRKDRLLTFSPIPSEPVIHCGKTAATSIVDGKTLSVEFISDGSEERKGFRALYRTYFEKDLRTTTLPRTLDRKCGGLLVKSGGTFSTPNYPNPYPNQIVCLWVIRIPKAKQITVTFEEFDLGSNGRDLLAYSEDGVYPWDKEPIVVTAPGKKQFTFLGDTAFFEFISDGSVSAKGFYARYESDRQFSAQATTVTTPQMLTTPKGKQDCGGSFSEETGQLTSPNYPENYDNSLDCKWIITVNPGQNIQVSFSDVYVEADGQCGYDYIEIGDGVRVGENTRNRLCGAIRYQKFTSTGNQIWIRFFTDSGVRNRGFKASWSSIQLFKTTKLPTTTEKATQTAVPDYLPKGWNYASPVSRKFGHADTGINNYVWAIDLNGRPFLRLNDVWIPVTDRAFSSITSGESGTWAVAADGKVVFRGGQLSAPEGSKWTSTGSSLFKMVDSGPFGFVTAINSNNDLVYRDRLSKLFPTGTEWKHLNKKLESVSIGSYGIWGIDRNQDIHFARRPSTFSASHLTWQIIPGPKLRQIDAGYANNVYGVGTKGQLYRRVGITFDRPEGEKWLQEDANIRSVTVGLKGVFGIARNNQIIYKSDFPTQCGGILTSSSGVIESPGFPISYPQNAHCLWIIKVPSAKSIRISIDSFEVHSSKDCKDDYVLLYKRGFYSPQYGVDKYCGSLSDFRRNVFDGEEVWILFQTIPTEPSSSRVKGFRLQYHADVGNAITRPTIPVATTLRTAPSTILHHTTTAARKGCGGSFSRDYGSFSSPGYPNLYQNSLRCIWTITVKPDRVITLTFDDFAVEEDIACRFDFVLVKTSSQNGLVLGKFCGSVRPPNIEVNGNKVWVLFKSDASEGKRGFRVIWSSQSKADNVVKSTSRPTTPYVQPKAHTTAKISKPSVIPVGWSEMFSNIMIAHIDGGITPNAWAVDKEGNTFFQEGKNWRIVLGSPMEYVTSGESGVWAIDKSGKTYYRRNIAPLAPMGAFWDLIDAPTLRRLDSGPLGVVIAVDESNRLLLREGISSNNPKGTGWRAVESGFKHISAGTYGYWIVDLNNQAYFSPISKLYPLARLRWTPVAGEFTQVKAGYGGSVWAVAPNKQLYRRRGITAITPTGLDWELIKGLKVNGVTTGMSGVFASVHTSDQVITTEDRKCGDILTGTTGVFSSPKYPFDYPPDTSCLWQIKVPNAKKIIVDFDSFNIEESDDASIVKCNKDYLLYLRDGRFPSAYAVQKRCGTDASPLIFDGDSAWIEFFSDASVNFMGFKARYRAVYDRPAVTDTPIISTMMPKTSSKVPSTITDLYTECGGTIDASLHSSGSFAHPGYPAAYNSYSSCRYLIKTSPSYRIKLDFDMFDLEGAQGCKYDYFEIFDGNSREENSLGKYCGTQKPVGVISSGDSLYLEFVSDSTTAGPGFLASWRREEKSPQPTAPQTKASTSKKIPEGPNVDEIRTACGGIIDAMVKTSGTLAHPGYPGFYRNGIECKYIISTVSGASITLSFEKFKLESSSFCQYDFLEVRDGRDENAKSIGRFCGEKKPLPITSSGNYLFLKFFSDDTTADLGFLAKWKTVIDNKIPTVTIAPYSACGGTLEKNEGLLASPGYPHEYTSDLDCVWIISVDPGKVIQLSFEFFGLEQSESSCIYDFVEVFDGSSALARRMGKYCNKMPNELTTSSNKMRIRFHSDKGKNYKGFLARWIAEEKPTPTTPSAVTQIKSCFQRVSGIAGEIHRGGLSSFYLPNQDCVWIITVPKDKIIKLAFEFLDLESSPYCTKDSIKLLDGPNDISKALGIFCGDSRVQDILSSGNEMFVRFKSDSTNNKRGFQIKWTAVSSSVIKLLSTQSPNYGVDICYGFLTGSSGYIVSPNYPNNYPSDLSCRKTIHSAPGTRIVISFPDFDLESSINCIGDVLVIKDGGIPTAPSLGKFCGSKVDAQVKSTGNSIFIEFVSDYSTAARGFRAFWRTEPLPPTALPTFTFGHITTVSVLPEAPVCGGKLFGSRGVLRSPTFERRYPFGISCIWVIEGGKSSVLDLRLRSFNIGSKDCSSSYLLLRDGRSSRGPKLAKLCSIDIEKTVTSSRNVIYIEYRMDADFDGNGFDLSWNERTLESSKAFECGGISTQSAGSIMSPAYPSTYGNNILCTWNLVAPKGYKVYLEFKKFDLDYDVNCTQDSLSIRDGFSSESSIIGRYCGKSLPNSVTSKLNSLFVELKTDCKRSGSGFSATWKHISDNTIQTNPTVPPTKSSSSLVKATTKKTTSRSEKQTMQQTQSPQPTIAENNVNSRGGLLTGVSGVLRSPNFPKNYPANQDIVWVIKGPLNGRIALNFRAFDLEEDSGCQYDFVQLRDGPSADSSVIGRFCGRHIPATYTSASNALWVRFYADSTDAGTGFEAVWRWIQSNNELPAQTIQNTQKASACGGIMNGIEGEISTSNHPQYYPPNNECIWIIRPKNSASISLRFKTFDIEPESRCGYDFVEVRNGDSSSSPLLGRFCGSSLPNVQSVTGKALWIRFKSDSSSNYRGFSASWKAFSGVNANRRRRKSIKEKKYQFLCGRALAGSNGTLKLPIKESWSLNPLYCEWTIKSLNGALISLHIRDLAFNKLDSCDKNYMDIRVERSGQLERLTRLCPSDRSNWYNGLSIPTGSKRVFVEYSLKRRLGFPKLRVKWTTKNLQGIF